jgi:hypothetical protein
MEAISHAGTVLGVLATDGVILMHTAENKVTGKESYSIFQKRKRAGMGMGIVVRRYSYSSTRTSNIVFPARISRILILKEKKTSYGGPTNSDLETLDRDEYIP